MSAEIDTELSIGDWALELGAKLSSGIADMNDKLGKLLEREWSAEAIGPVRVKLRATGTADANGDILQLDLGGPGQGRVWEVRRVIVGGLLFSSAVNGAARLVVGPNANLQAEAPLPDVADNAASLPSIAFYSAGQLTVRSNERLFVVISGPAANGNYAAGGEAFDLPEQGRHQVFAV